jgi:hypothetical protein
MAEIVAGCGLGCGFAGAVTSRIHWTSCWTSPCSCPFNRGPGRPACPAWAACRIGLRSGLDWSTYCNTECKLRWVTRAACPRAAGGRKNFSARFDDTLWQPLVPHRLSKSGCTTLAKVSAVPRGKLRTRRSSSAAVAMRFSLSEGVAPVAFTFGAPAPAAAARNPIVDLRHRALRPRAARSRLP